MKTPCPRALPVIRISLLCGLALVARPTLAAPPINDNFTNRTALAGLNVAARATNNFATGEIGEPRHAGQGAMRSLWWSWRPPVDGLAELLVTNVGAPQTRSAVYTGDVLTNLSLIISNAATTNRTLSFVVKGSETYQLAVDQLTTASPTAFDINLTLNSFFFTHPTLNSRVTVGIALALAATNSLPDQIMTRID